MAKTGLEQRFKFTNDSLASETNNAKSTLWLVADRNDNNSINTLRLWKKTNTRFDADLEELLQTSIRRVTRVLSSRHAREVMVEVLELVQDTDEIGVLLATSGKPISSSSKFSARRKDQDNRQATSRLLMWENIHRIAKALGYLHKSKIIHGNIGIESIYTESLHEADYKLSGFEWSLHLVNDLSGAGTSLQRPVKRFSFRNDWQCLGQTVVDILKIETNTLLRQGVSFLTPSEHRVLTRLLHPLSIGV